MAVLWSLTRAAVKLLFQDNDLSYSIQQAITTKITETTQGEMSDRSSYQPFGTSINLQNAKIILSKRKLIKLSESVIPHQTLFQHQLGFAMHLT